MRLALSISILALGALLAVPAAAPAGVIQVVTPENTLAEGPMLAGNRVAWEENRCTSPGGCGFEAATRYRIRAAGPGGIRTLSEGRIRSLPGGSNSFFSTVSFELSAHRFALVRSEFGTLDEQDFARERTFAGARDGSGLKRLVRCEAEQQTVVNPIAVSGRRVAFDPDPCDDQPEVEIRAPGSLTRIAVFPPTGPLVDLALADRYLATVHAGQVSLHDISNGEELFSAPLPSGALHGVDVARDGRLAVTVGADRIGRRTCHPSRLWIRDAGGASLELKRPQPCWDARLTRDGVVYLRGGRRPARLELQSPGGSMRVIAEFGARGVREQFDAQHMRAAFAVSCGGRLRIRVVSLGKPARAC
jgi:hypothetical protein